MNANERADAIIQDILTNHLPRVIEGLKAGYVDENQVLVIYDHAVRARILKEFVAAQPALEHDDNLSKLNRELEAECKAELEAEKRDHLQLSAIMEAEGLPKTKLAAAQDIHCGVITQVDTSGRVRHTDIYATPKESLALNDEIEIMMAVIVGRNILHGDVSHYVGGIENDGLPKFTDDKRRALVHPVNIANDLAKKWTDQYADMHFSAETVRDARREPAVPVKAALARTESAEDSQAKVAVAKALDLKQPSEQSTGPSKETYTFVLDKDPIATRKRIHTGAMLRVLLPEAKRGYAIFQEAEGTAPDIQIKDDSTVAVDGLVFYSVPPATFGASKLTCICGGEIREMPTSVETMLKCAACERVYMDEDELARVKKTEVKAGQKFVDGVYFSTCALPDGVPLETEINLNGDKIKIKAKEGKFMLTYEEVVRMAVNHYDDRHHRAPFTGPDSDLPMFSCTYHHRVAWENLHGERNGSLYKGSKPVECTPGMSITCLSTSNA
jgi:hypothetical protein